MSFSFPLKAYGIFNCPEDRKSDHWSYLLGAWCCSLPSSLPPFLHRSLLLTAFSSVCIAGAVRIAYLAAVFNPSSDYTWTGTDLWIITAAELDLGIVCASVPALKAFLARFFPRLLHRATISKSIRSISSRSYPYSRRPGSTNERKRTESEEFIITIGMGSIGPEMAKNRKVEQAQEGNIV